MKIFTTILGCLLFLSTQTYSQGTLEDIESNISFSSSDGGSGGGDLGATIDAIVFMADVGYSLFFRFNNEAPIYLSPQNGGKGFTKYPYAEGDYGLHYNLGEGGYNFSGELRGHYFGESLDLVGQSLQFRVSPLSALNLQGKYINFSERLGNGTDDQLNYYNAAISYNRIRTPKFTFYWGGGITSIKRERQYTNVSFNTGMKWFVFSPVSLHADFMVTGFDGTAVFLGDFRMQYHIKRMFLYAGYQGLWLDDTSVAGLTGGLGIYF